MIRRLLLNFYEDFIFSVFVGDLNGKDISSHRRQEITPLAAMGILDISFAV
jgi:hypothetical protein